MYIWLKLKGKNKIIFCRSCSINKLIISISLFILSNRVIQLLHSELLYLYNLFDCIDILLKKRLHAHHIFLMFAKINHYLNLEPEEWWRLKNLHQQVSKLPMFSGICHNDAHNHERLWRLRAKRTLLVAPFLLFYLHCGNRHMVNYGNAKGCSMLPPS